MESDILSSPNTTINKRTILPIKPRLSYCRLALLHVQKLYLIISNLKLPLQALNSTFLIIDELKAWILVNGR